MAARYFDEVYRLSREFVDGLNLPRLPDGLDALLKVRRPAIEAAQLPKIGQLQQARSLLRADPSAATEAAGMNTVGMLCDRLTVLTMKEWALRNRFGKPADAVTLRETQIEELLQVLDRIRPGHSSFTQKLTKLKFEARIDSWEGAYFGLLVMNTLLWEAQEVLYAGNLQELPSEEIRRYIAWFSEGNILRNHYIAGCENAFWQLVRERAG